MGRPTTIAVFTKNMTNPAYAAARRAADLAALAAGARTVHFVPQVPDDVGEQTAMVDAAIAQRPDAIALVPVHDNAMIAPVRRINAAQIPLVGFINRIAGDFITFVGSDDVQVGYAQARALCERLGGRGTVAVIEGVAGAPTSRDRLAGTKRALAEFPGIELVASGIGNYQRAEAKHAMAAMLAGHRRIDGVIAANDLMALGAIAALREAGRTAHIVGVNGILEAVKAIEAGTLHASVDFDAFKMASIAMQAALRHLAGQPVPREIMLPTVLIDRTNFSAWLRPISERTSPRWEEVVGSQDGLSASETHHLSSCKL